MRLEKDVHLTYCTNIHPGTSWSEIKASIETYGPEIKKRVSPDREFSIGLRLSNIAAEELLEKDNLQNFRRYLDEENLYVCTLNGFPYGSFHRERIKDDVHSPDWQTDQRGDYTIRLVQILSELLPADIMEGSISTSPLSYKPWIKKDDPELWDRCVHQMIRVSAEMIKIRENTGKLIHINIEPEPDGLVEDSMEVVRFFQDHLLVKGIDELVKSTSLNQTEAREALLDHIRVCLDTCHMAIEYETPQAFIGRLNDAGIKIGKIQVSSALKVPFTDDLKTDDGLELIKNALLPFEESTYLHQVIQKNHDKTLSRYTDLQLALKDIQNNTEKAQEWRVHFHVPVFVKDYTYFQSTQKEIIDTLKIQKAQPFSSHLEIETYTWDVLPKDLKDDLTNLITREFEWVMNTWSQIPDKQHEPAIE